MTDLLKTLSYAKDARWDVVSKALKTLEKHFYLKKVEAMANKRIYYVTESIGITCALKIGDKVKVIENDEGFKKSPIKNTSSDFQAYRASIGQEYEITGVVNLKDGVYIAISNTEFLYPSCIFEKIGEAEQKSGNCVCDITLLMSRGCQCKGN